MHSGELSCSGGATSPGQASRNVPPEHMRMVLPLQKGLEYFITVNEFSCYCLFESCCCFAVT